MPGTTVLLASAPQSSYWELGPFRGLPVTNVIANPVSLHAGFRRVRWQWPVMPRPTLAPSRGAGSPGPQVLAAVNTTADSALLYRQLEQRRDGLLGPCLHLSTTIVDRHLR